MALPGIKQRMARFAGRFYRSCKGAMAVEFALVAAPFFFLLFAIIEVTMVFFTSTALENATMDTARKIRTGELQTTGATGADFINQVCADMSGLVTCNGNVSADVRTFADFGDISTNKPIDQDGKLDSGSFQFDPGNAGDIVLVRVFFTWQLNTPVIGTLFANMAGNKRLIVASAAFRNEPYGIP